MSAQIPARPSETVDTAMSSGHSARGWILKRICSQNPFYLLSVCFVLHGTARWFHTESGVAFSPWPLLWLTTGYTLLLAMTGFVIVRFGKVWDDARSILLVILLMFVELSLIFDETLVRDPFAGRLLLFICWAFSIALSEILLVGLKIRLPWSFRVPYQGLLTLLFLYPFSLVSLEDRLPVEIVQWRIFLFPTVAAAVMLTLIPAIRHGSNHTRENGTPWLWPWYPWSLFVFLGICICFRAYALSQSFDPVLGESFQSALSFSTAFGIFFLVPMVFASALLMLEIGIIENRRTLTELAMWMPILCGWLAVPATVGSGPYEDFLRMVLIRVGSPVWVAGLTCIAFYALALARRIPHAEHLLGLTLFGMTRIGPQTIDLSTFTATQWWPLLLLSGIEFCSGLVRRDAHRVFVGCCLAIVVLNFGIIPWGTTPMAIRSAAVLTSVLASVLFVGAIYDDDFAWLLRLMGAPLLVMACAAGCVFLRQTTVDLPVWIGPAFVLFMTFAAYAYASIVGMSLYRFVSMICGAIGSLALIEMTTAYLIRESGWRGANSFVSGICFLIVAVSVSSWKAGWLANSPIWLRRILIVPISKSA